MSGRKELVALFVLVAAGCFAADIASKYTVGFWLDHGEVDSVVIPGWFNIIYRINEGGIWSIGRQFGAAMNGSLAVFSVLAVGLILSLAFVAVRSGDRWMAVVLGAILGGALGNLYDRILFQGVRDFLDFHYYDVYHYPTFNLADSFLVCGAVALIVTSLFARAMPEQKPALDKSAG